MMFLNKVNIMDEEINKEIVKKCVLGIDEWTNIV